MKSESYFIDTLGDGDDLIFFNVNEGFGESESWITGYYVWLNIPPPPIMFSSVPSPRLSSDVTGLFLIFIGFLC